MTITVAVIGNHRHHHCSEAVWARAFARLGCDVISMQVDEVANDPDTAMERLRHCTLVSYTRTHSRGMYLDPSWTDRWQTLAKAGVRTVGIHLDRFWDLEREGLIGSDAQFTVATFWSADGGNDDRWKAAGILHRWFVPGVDDDEAIVGTYRPELAADVLFVGSGGQTYHMAYSGRADLLAHLRLTYRSRFVHVGYGGDRPVVRGQALADTYASAKVIIGDSCFANEKGSPRSARYLSDRCSETLGRRGCLVHPFVPGLRELYSPSELLCHAPADYDDLDAQVGMLLANPGEREGYAERGRARVLRDHVYTVRMREILTTLGLPVPVDEREPVA